MRNTEEPLTMTEIDKDCLTDVPQTSQSCPNDINIEEKQNYTFGNY